MKQYNGIHCNLLFDIIGKYTLHIIYVHIDWTNIYIYIYNVYNIYRNICTISGINDRIVFKRFLVTAEGRSLGVPHPCRRLINRFRAVFIFQRSRRRLHATRTYTFVPYICVCVCVCVLYCIKCRNCTFAREVMKKCFPSSSPQNPKGYNVYIYIYIFIIYSYCTSITIGPRERHILQNRNDLLAYLACYYVHTLKSRILLLFAFTYVGIYCGDLQNSSCSMYEYTIVSHCKCEWMRLYSTYTFICVYKNRIPGRN